MSQSETVTEQDRAAALALLKYVALTTHAADHLSEWQIEAATAVLAQARAEGEAVGRADTVAEALTRERDLYKVAFHNAEDHIAALTGRKGFAMRRYVCLTCVPPVGYGLLHFDSAESAEKHYSVYPDHIFVAETTIDEISDNPPIVQHATMSTEAAQQQQEGEEG